MSKAIEEAEKSLIYYIREVSIAKVTLSQLKGRDLDSMEIQLALCEKLQVAQPLDLLEKTLSSE